MKKGLQIFYNNVSIVNTELYLILLQVLLQLKKVEHIQDVILLISLIWEKHQAHYQIQFPH
jgi:hypothetical protein